MEGLCMTFVIRSTRFRTCLAAVTLTVIAAPAASQTHLQLDPRTTETQAPAPSGGVSPSPAFARLFQDTFDDFRRLPSKETVSTTFSGSVRLGDFLGAGQSIGSARFQLGGAFATYALGRAFGNGNVTTIGADLVRANLVAQTLTSAVKLSVRRTRPDGTQFSFPSGHTSVSFASATVLQRHLGWKAGVPAYAVATYVAASRVQDKRHFLSDVAFGAALGIVAGRTVTFGRGEHRVTMSPAATPGGGGLSLTWK
jgi:membrane-associated phospholipid phosphatase